MNNLDLFGYNPHSYDGLRVVRDSRLTKAGNPYEVERTWKERLFTRPWEPLKATRTVVPQIPSDQFIFTKDCIVCHPEMVSKLGEFLQNKN